MVARQIATHRHSTMLLQCIINKDAVLSQLNAALFRLIPPHAVQSICIKHRYAGQSTNIPVGAYPHGGASVPPARI